MKRHWIAFLLRLYPSRWRSEYGAELAGLLAARPLTAREFWNVAAHAAWQQLRLQEPWLLMAVPATALSVIGCARVMAGMPFAAREHEQNFTGAAIALAVFFATGYWTMWRKGKGAGRAAIAFNLLATAPYLLLGLASVAGLAPIATVDRGASVNYWRGVLLTAPFFQVAVAGTAGWLGGLAARVVRRLHPRATA
jgi:hypothetical protein